MHVLLRRHRTAILKDGSDRVMDPFAYGIRHRHAPKQSVGTREVFEFALLSCGTARERSIPQPMMDESKKSDLSMAVTTSANRDPRSPVIVGLAELAGRRGEAKGNPGGRSLCRA